MVAEATLTMTGATLVPAPGAGPESRGLELRVDALGVTQLGGDPATAWQVPWVACRDVRVRASHGVVLLAVSFGALRYRWEIPYDGIPGGPDAAVAVLRAMGGARPMAPLARVRRRR
jgi:hypothetical protein